MLKRRPFVVPATSVATVVFTLAAVGALCLIAPQAASANSGETVFLTKYGPMTMSQYIERQQIEKMKVRVGLRRREQDRLGAALS